MPEENEENGSNLPARAQSKTGVMLNQLEVSAARDERNDERMFQLMQQQLADAKDQRASAEKQSTLWFRLAMAELLVIVAIAVVILGRSMSVDTKTGTLEITPGTTENGEQ